MKKKNMNADLTPTQGSCPNPDASLNLGTRVKFQSKRGCHTLSKMDVRVAFYAKRDSRITPQNASLGSLAFQLKGLSSVVFQLQREPVNFVFQHRCKHVSSASNNRMRSASSARPAFCCN